MIQSFCSDMFLVFVASETLLFYFPILVEELIFLLIWFEGFAILEERWLLKEVIDNLEWIAFQSCWAVRIFMTIFLAVSVTLFNAFCVIMLLQSNGYRNLYYRTFIFPPDILDLTCVYCVFVIWWGRGASKGLLTF